MELSNLGPHVIGIKKKTDEFMGWFHLVMLVFLFFCHGIVLKIQTYDSNILSKFFPMKNNNLFVVQLKISEKNTKRRLAGTQIFSSSKAALACAQRLHSVVQ